MTCQGVNTLGAQNDMVSTFYTCSMFMLRYFVKHGGMFYIFSLKLTHNVTVLSDESGASDDEHFYPGTSDSDADQSFARHHSNQPITVAVSDVYKPPTELHRVGCLFIYCISFPV